MKPFDILLTDAAYDDLIDIRHWIAQHADEETAHRFIDRIEARISKLAYFPDKGTPHPNIRPDTRSASFERSYLIFYHVEEQVVWIDRVISARRDIDNLN